MKERGKLKKLQIHTDTDTEHDSNYKEVSSKNPDIEDCSHCPRWQLRKLDNKYLYDGYRVNYNTYSDLFRSIWDLHNETCNIWTHLIGALIFIWFIYFNFQNFLNPMEIKTKVVLNRLENYGDEATADFVIENIQIIIEKMFKLQSENKSRSQVLAVSIWSTMIREKKLNKFIGPQADKFSNALIDTDFFETFNKNLKTGPFFGFLFCAVICFTFSTLMHTFWIKSKKDSKIFLKLDYSGIAILIFGSICSGVYYAIPCLGFRFIFIYTTAFFSLLTLGMINLDKFRKTPKHMKAGLFIVQGCISILPILYWVYAT